MRRRFNSPKESETKLASPSQPTPSESGSESDINLDSFSSSSSSSFSLSTLYLSLPSSIQDLISQAHATFLLIVLWLGLDSMAIGDWLGVGVGAKSSRLDAAIEMKSPRSGMGGEGGGGGRKVKRRRAGTQKATMNGSERKSEGFYPGMVNLSGTLCYMNSVLQSFASIPSLVVHLERITALAIECDIPTPVTDALLDVINDLNTPHQRPPSALRPAALIQALSTLPQVRRLLGTRDQQDAHELFVVLAEAVSDEAVKVASEVARARGLGDVSTLQAYVSAVDVNVNRADRSESKVRERARGLAQPWEGLLARRRVCKKCGWSEAVRMDTLGGMELPLPVSGDVSLEACIAEYLAPENLSDVTCEMCSLQQTAAHYAAEADRLMGVVPVPSSSSTPTSTSAFAAIEDAISLTPNNPTNTSPITSSRKKRATIARKVVARLRSMLESNTVSNFGQSTLPPPHGSNATAALPIKWVTVKSDSFREAAISRPPTVLRLHLVRSEFTPYGNIIKKTARVAFPMILDLTRFTTMGVWENRSSIQELLAKSKLAAATATGLNDRQSSLGSAVQPRRRVIYRLESAIMHLGYTHSSGHYICFRRIPEGDGKPAPAIKSCPDGCVCESCVYFGQVRASSAETAAVPRKGWLQISDADVEEVGEEALLAARGSVFMLFYELVRDYVNVQQ